MLEDLLVDLPSASAAASETVGVVHLLRSGKVLKVGSSSLLVRGRQRLYRSIAGLQAPLSNSTGTNLEQLPWW